MRTSFFQKLAQAPQDVQAAVTAGEFGEMDSIIVNLEKIIDFPEDDIPRLITKSKGIWQTDAKKRVDKIKLLTSQHLLSDAEKELAELANLMESKYSGPLKAQIISLTADVDSLKHSLFNWDLVRIFPQKASEQLENARSNSFTQYKDRLENLEKTLTGMYERALNGLQMSPITTYSLQQLAEILQDFGNMIEAFQKAHPEFSEKVKSQKERLISSLNSHCKELKIQYSQAKKQKQWNDVETKLKMLVYICSILGKYLPSGMVDEIRKQETDITTIITGIKSNLEYLQKLNFFAPVPLLELNKVLSQIKQNASVQFYAQNTDEVVITYPDAVQLVIKQVQELHPIVMKFWNEVNYEPTAQVLENLKQSSKLVEHDVVFNSFKTTFDVCIAHMKRIIAEIVEQCKAFLKAQELEKVEQQLMKYRTIEKSLGSITELFPSTKNEVVEELQLSIAQQAQEFYGKFTTTVPSIEEVCSLMLGLKKFTAAISNTQLGAFVHTQMNNVLNHLTGMKEFDVYELGQMLCTSGGHLGRDIVEGDNFPQFKSLIIAKINEITSRMTPDDALAALITKNKLTTEQSEALKTAYSRFNSEFQKLLNQYPNAQFYIKSIVDIFC